MHPSHLLMPLALLVAPATLHAHIHLVKSTPAADSLARGPLREIRLTFSERPELGFSRIRLFTADSTEIPLGMLAAVAGDSMTVIVPLTQPLPAGVYTVRWQTAGRDGHVLRGAFAFSAPAEPVGDTVTPTPAPSDSVVPPAAGDAGGFPIALIGIALAGALAAYFFLRRR